MIDDNDEIDDDDGIDRNDAITFTYEYRREAGVWKPIGPGLFEMGPWGRFSDGEVRIERDGDTIKVIVHSADFPFPRDEITGRQYAEEELHSQFPDEVFLQTGVE
jgi:hypothetical protein